MESRRVVILAYQGVQPLDVTGPAEVFSAAGQLARGSYTVEVVAPERKPISTRSGGYGIVPAKSTGACRGQSTR